MATQMNVLIPSHRKLSDEEVVLLLEKYSLDEVAKLPKIKLKDPALADLNVEAGSVVEISRNKSFVGSSKYYRVVVE